MHLARTGDEFVVVIERRELTVRLDVAAIPKRDQAKTARKSVDQRAMPNRARHGHRS